MVRARTANDRARLAPEEVSETPARAATSAPPQHNEAGVVTGDSDNVEKCINCQFYDRRHARPTDGKAPMWGQCRRHSPHLNPVTAKAYVVEGVWPLVRDDDWCGEWRVLTRVVEEWTPDAAPAAVAETQQSDSAPSRPLPPPHAPPSAVVAVAAAGDD